MGRIITWIGRILLVVSFIPICLAGGCIALVGGYGAFYTVTMPIRALYLEAGTIESIIHMDGYTLFFFHFRDANNQFWWELWRSDGTTQGTYRLIKQVSHGDPNIQILGRYHNLLLFQAVGAPLHNGGGGSLDNPILWHSDGTSNGTLPTPGLTNFYEWPNHLVQREDAVYFYAQQFGATPYCDVFRGTGASSSTFQLQQITTKQKDCAGIAEAPMLATYLPCIEWQQVTVAGIDTYRAIACPTPAPDHGSLSAVMNTNHTIAITKQDTTGDGTTILQTAP